jgi:23S rRNA (cytosine1962-C5)-methyltransferase
MLHTRRYQLKKETVAVVAKGHPWIFRSHLSSAAEVFQSGDWLKLVDPQNHAVGFGLYEPEGLIALRVFRRGKTPPDLPYWDGLVDKALSRRVQLRKYTNAFRALHGENDGAPGIVFDVYGDTGVLQTYARSVDPVGRYLANKVTQSLNLQRVLWKFPAKRQGKSDELPNRVLKGDLPGLVSLTEGKLRLFADLSSGQKSGTFLDLRGLRKWIALQRLHGKRVLNLFSYTGTLGLAAESAGAREIINLDISKGALKFGERHHQLKPGHQRWIEADVFEWLKKTAVKETFDLIIVDPPQVASQTSQVPQAIKMYRRLYESALQFLSPKGTLIACCCTSRIHRSVLRKELQTLFGRRLKLTQELKPEDDHPVGFDEGDYLKILVFARGG